MSASKKRKISGLSSLSFSAVNEGNLKRLNITQAGVLRLQGKLRDAIESTRELGVAELWSNGNMYKQLAFLSNTCSNMNEASARLFIDTFFFRVAAMLPSDQRVVVMLEKQVHPARPRESKMDSVSGVIDYTALVTNADLASIYLAFFTAEAKASHSHGILLLDHIPQALVELVACAKHLEHAHIRGALTTGDQWIFLAVDLDILPEEALDVTVPATSDRHDPAVIAGILSSWVPNSFSEFNGDKWFGKFPLPVLRR
ncbi:hypothetical protein BJ912DRAFT_1059572 [Pholiota molesta]|nr:hypothetical protein BJ912DRAFT_1059572 [Pholiota molesta]